MENKTSDQICLQRQLADLITRLGNLNEIRLLIAQGAKVNHPVCQGLSLLHYATYAQYAECVELLIIRGANLNQVDEIGYTALHLAAEKGYIEIIRILIKAGAKVRFTEDNVISQTDEPFRLAVKGGFYACAKLLLENGANPNAVYFLGSELNLAASSTGNLKFIELLLKHGANVESRNRSGLTPLMQVAQASDGYEATKLLLKYNANCNHYAPEVNEDYRTVLHYAVKSGNYSLLRLLLFCGANPIYPSEVLKKPSSLGFAIIKGDLNMIKLLIQFGAQLNTGCSLLGLPLHIAVSKKIKNREQIILHLLENGADPNLITMENNRGPCLKSPIGEYFNNSEEPELHIVRLLLKYNARVICTAQVQHPLGCLKSLNKVRLNSLNDEEESIKQDQQLYDQVELNEQLAFAGDKQARLFYLLCNSCELYNIQAIRRCTLLNQNQKRVLLYYAKNPMKLKHLARLSLRRYVFKFAQAFFDDDQNASSAYYALENRFQQNSPGLKSRSFDYSAASNELAENNWQNHDLMNDSYILNKNAYRKYVGNRYQKQINRIEDKLFCRVESTTTGTKKSINNQTETKLVFNQKFAISCGLTTEEMEIVKMRREHELNELQNNENLYSFNRNLCEINEKQERKLSNRSSIPNNVAMLPVGFRVPPGSEWPLRLVDLDSKFNDYNFKYYSSLNSASSLIDQLREYFMFDSDRFKCSSSFAVHILSTLPMPQYLRKYVLYEDE